MTKDKTKKRKDASCYKKGISDEQGLSDAYRKL